MAGAGTDMDEGDNSTSLEAVLPGGGTPILQFVEDRIQTTMLTGIAIGAAVALLLIAVIVFVVYRRVRQSKQLQPHVPQYRFSKSSKGMCEGQKIIRKNSWNSDWIADGAAVASPSGPTFQECLQPVKIEINQ